MSLSLSLSLPHAHTYTHTHAHTHRKPSSSPKPQNDSQRGYLPNAEELFAHPTEQRHLPETPEAPAESNIHTNQHAHTANGFLDTVAVSREAVEYRRQFEALLKSDRESDRESESDTETLNMSDSKKESLFKSYFLDLFRFVKNSIL